MKYLIEKQRQWAANHKISLIGSHGDRGDKLYTENLNDNLLCEFDDDVRIQFEKGDGNELNSSSGASKMQALHSSAALCVNIFAYWHKTGRENGDNFYPVTEILHAAKLIKAGTEKRGKISFEAKFPISEDFTIPPNLDLLIEPDSFSGNIEAYAVECKFTEPYSSYSHSGLKKDYLLKEEIWEKLDNIHQLACELSPDDNRFKFLHAAQLIKHILGLNKKYKHGKYRLLYLWYDNLSDQGAEHLKEIQSFAETAEKDGVQFHHISYQNLIMNLAAAYRKNHPEYIEYITERYL
jgi:hypothetical protein